jgi:hypothetical protein
MRRDARTNQVFSATHAVARAGWWKSKSALVVLNIIGGIAVLGSYVHGLASHPLTRADVWGAVPESLRPIYTVSMLCAAAGYFPLTYYVLFRIDPDRIRIAERFGYGAFHILYGCVLVFSALWMPLTFAMLEQPSFALWYAIRLALAIVGLASLGLLAALLTARPREPGIAYSSAVAGCIAFCIQTALLDALVWPAFFPL